MIHYLSFKINVCLILKIPNTYLNNQLPQDLNVKIIRLNLVIRKNILCWNLYGLAKVKKNPDFCTPSINPSS